VRLGVGEKEWAFKTTLEVAESELASPNVDLVFEGLDTFATVKLVSFLFLTLF
jgi:beta-mannosidase